MSAGAQGRGGWRDRLTGVARTPAAGAPGGIRTRRRLGSQNLSRKFCDAAANFWAAVLRRFANPSPSGDRIGGTGHRGEDPRVDTSVAASRHPDHTPAHRSAGTAAHRGRNACSGGNPNARQICCACASVISLSWRSGHGPRTAGTRFEPSASAPDGRYRRSRPMASASGVPAGSCSATPEDRPRTGLPLRGCLVPAGGSATSPISSIRRSFRTPGQMRRARAARPSRSSRCLIATH